MTNIAGIPLIKEDCRRIAWDRPCRPHKERGQTCGACPDYAPTGKRIVIVKLDALGDVLRTTCVLEGLREKFEDAHITWIAREEAMPILQDNPCIDRILPYGTDALTVLLTERFDIVFNPDAAPASAALASLVKARVKKGIFLDENGRLRPASKVAQEWMLMGMRDDLKKANKATYQEIVLGMLNLRPRSREIILSLADEERERAKAVMRGKGLRRGRLLLGVNTGGGKKWELKQWSISNCVNFIQIAHKELKATIALFGGSSERERNMEIIRRSKVPVVDTGCDNTLREFFALLDTCGAIVTSDSLGLHAALALKKKVVALFGPTSAAEIDMYGRGKKVVADVDCRACYLPRCDKPHTCMDSIKPEDVLSALKSLL